MDGLYPFGRGTGPIFPARTLAAYRAPGLRSLMGYLLPVTPLIVVQNSDGANGHPNEMSYVLAPGQSAQQIAICCGVD